MGEENSKKPEAKNRLIEILLEDELTSSYQTGEERKGKKLSPLPLSVSKAGNQDTSESTEVISRTDLPGQQDPNRTVVTLRPTQTNEAPVTKEIEKETAKETLREEQSADFKKAAGIENLSAANKASSTAPHPPPLPPHFAKSTSPVAPAAMGAPPRPLSSAARSAREPVVDITMRQSEHLRVAQDRIRDLETMVDKLRSENEQLRAAGQVIRDKHDELTTRLENLQREFKDKIESRNQEKQILDDALKAKGKENSTLKMKIEEMESRLNVDLRRVRIHERELENRLEMIKEENSALLRSKDEKILELGRKIDQMDFELENYRNKAVEMNKKYETNQERVRRAVKALRLALSTLEGDESDS